MLSLKHGENIKHNSFNWN